MVNFNTIDEILDYAIDQERQAYDFYMNLAGRTENKQLKQAFEDFAHEEKAHVAILESVKKNKNLMPDTAKVSDLKIADYSVDVDESDLLDGADLQKVYILAMKKEKAAYKMYSDLAMACDDENCKKALESLAQEEARHKLHIEIEYDEHFFSEN
ncbi:MAG: ferritin family protein [Phycisphaerae bacterium]|nr:ferritin family protein [Phycisphaerae bacterium]